MLFNDAITIWGAFLIVGFVALAGSVLALAAGEVQSEKGRRSTHDSIWFYASVLAAGVAGVGLAGTVGALAGFGPVISATLIFLSAIIHGALAYNFIRPLLRGESLLEG